MAAKTKAENEEEFIDGEEFIVGEADNNPKKEKKDKKKNKNKKEKKKGKLLFLLIAAVVIGALVAVLFFNAGNIREKYLRGTLEKIPVVKNILPEENENSDEFSGLSKEALASKARTLNEENKKLEDEKTALNDEIKSLNDEMVRLKEIEANQLAYKNDKEAFDRMIAENDPDAYRTFYEEIEPETAKEIYEEIIGNSQKDKELKKYVQTFENMKKDAAAKVLEEMMGTDMDLVVQILNNTSNEQRADILASMDAENAAVCARQMAPEE